MTAVESGAPQSPIASDGGKVLFFCLLHRYATSGALLPNQLWVTVQELLRE